MAATALNSLRYRNICYSPELNDPDDPSQGFFEWESWFSSPAAVTADLKKKSETRDLKEIDHLRLDLFTIACLRWQGKVPDLYAYDADNWRYLTVGWDGSDEATWSNYAQEWRELLRLIAENMDTQKLHLRVSMYWAIRMFRESCMTGSQWQYEADNKFIYDWCMDVERGMCEELGGGGYP